MWPLYVFDGPAPRMAWMSLLQPSSEFAVLSHEPLTAAASFFVEWESKLDTWA